VQPFVVFLIGPGPMIPIIEPFGVSRDAWWNARRGTGAFRDLPSWSASSRGLQL